MNKILALFSASLLISACSSGGTMDGGTTTIYNLTSGGGTGGTSTGGGTAIARLRVGALSSDAQPFDYCLAVHGTEDAGGFIGPVMLNRGAVGGLVFPSVSDYSSLTPDTYDLHTVPPAASSCYVDGGPIADVNLPALAAGESYTVAIMGPVASPTIKTLTDDTTGPDAGDLGLRLIQASRSFGGADMTANGKLVFANLPYATVAPASGGAIPIDANGYATLKGPDAGLVDGGSAGYVPPLTFDLSFAQHGSGSQALVVPCVTFTEGSVNSVYTIPPPTGYTGTLSAFVCYDSLEPVAGFTKCDAMPVPGSVCP